MAELTKRARVQAEIAVTSCIRLGQLYDGEGGRLGSNSAALGLDEEFLRGGWLALRDETGSNRLRALQAGVLAGCPQQFERVRRYRGERRHLCGAGRDCRVRGIGPSTRLAVAVPEQSGDRRCESSQGVPGECGERGSCA